MIPVLVTSGKGGVGKTTIAVNLAYALAARGIRVSLMDADLLAPNTHMFFDAQPEAVREHGRSLRPLEVDKNIEFMGLGVFIPRGVGVAMSYEKAMDFIITMLKFVRWSGDYLIIDSPPGSIDINVRLFRELSGRARAVVVGEPHPFAIEDNLRMLDLLRFYDIEVRALVLNKYNLFPGELAKTVTMDYEKLAGEAGFKIVRIPWDPELQSRSKPRLFEKLVEVVVG